jgi:hypothetical protein
MEKRKIVYRREEGWGLVNPQPVDITAELFRIAHVTAVGPNRRGTEL